MFIFSIHLLEVNHATIPPTAKAKAIHAAGLDETNRLATSGISDVVSPYLLEKTESTIVDLSLTDGSNILLL